MKSIDSILFKGCAGGEARRGGLVRQVGWREWGRLPELGIRRLKTKIDTGARACALHAEEYKLRSTPDGDVIHFKLKPKSKWRQASCIGYRTIKDTGGKVTERPVIRTILELGGEKFEAEICLVNRSAMRHRLIIGRQVIGGRFIVDASRTFLHPIPSLAAKKIKSLKEQELVKR